MSDTSDYESDSEPDCGDEDVNCKFQETCKWVPKNPCDRQCSALCATTGKRCRNKATYGLNLVLADSNDQNNGVVKSMVITGVSFLGTCSAWVTKRLTEGEQKVPNVVRSNAKKAFKGVPGAIRGELGAAKDIANIVANFSGLSGNCCQVCTMHFNMKATNYMSLVNNMTAFFAPSDVKRITRAINKNVPLE